MNREQQLDMIQRDTGMDRTQAHYHLQGREILRLRLASPKRAEAGRAAAAQADAAHLPLFVAGNEPTLF